MELRASNIIDSEIEGHYAFFPFVEGISTRAHQHNFYEIFLIGEGSIEHHVNGACFLLEKGSLVFIRPLDAHFFRQHDNHNCQLINLAFLTQTFEALSLFLGIDEDILLLPEQSPSVVLTQGDRINLQTQLQTWGRLLYGDKIQSRQNLRALLAGIISRYFSLEDNNHIITMPMWLRDLIETMNQPPYFIEGREALIRLSNRTPEYMGRIFRQYLNTTPSGFINNLRLDYASDLLLHTDLSPTDICYEAGFGNLSYFYHLFKTRWNCSPNQFRKQHQLTLIP